MGFMYYAKLNIPYSFWGAAPPRPPASEIQFQG